MQLELFETLVKDGVVADTSARKLEILESLLKELEDRSGKEIHLSDAIEAIHSLSDQLYYSGNKILNGADNRYGTLYAITKLSVVLEIFRKLYGYNDREMSQATQIQYDELEDLLNEIRTEG